MAPRPLKSIVLALALGFFFVCGASAFDGASRSAYTFKQAETYLEDIVKKSPDSGNAWSVLALVIAAQRRFPEALGPAQNAAKLMPDNPQAVTALGMISSRCGLHPQAIESLRRVIQMQPSSAQARLNLGIALADAGDLAAAISEFRRAANRDPNNQRPHYSLGRALFEAHQPQDAFPELSKAVSLDPRNGQVLYFLALAERALHGPSASAPILETLVRLEPDNSQAHSRLGDDLFAMGKVQIAGTEWRKALALDPKDQPTAYHLSHLLAKRDPKEAELYTKRFSEIERDRQREDRAKNLGLIYARSGDGKNALLELQKAKILLPSDPEILQSLRLLTNPPLQ